MAQTQHVSATAAGTALREFIEPEKAAFLPVFFKAFPGGYGEGDQFLGVRVPNIRRVARGCRDLPLSEVAKLLGSPWHEERLLALVIMTSQFDSAAKGNAPHQEAIIHLLMEHIHCVNNWDLTDLCATKLLGPWLCGRDKELLYQWAKKEDLWLRRMSIIATYAFIRLGEYQPTLRLAEMLSDDEEDLIHKAVGWMLREVANRDMTPAIAFLSRHQLRMPRTMLRYAIEKYPPLLKQQAMAGTLGAQA